ncbi:MAG: L-type lectin-domain containing protein [Phycisphaerae bacterium]|nr:L-type lectin-domain containing protein [Phycisphaerae bacterium]
MTSIHAWRRRYSCPDFAFRITDPDGSLFDCNVDTGADGLVFVVQSISSSVGGLGRGIGYAGIQQSVGVEFDTWCNAVNNDPSSNHVGINVNGVVDHTFSDCSVGSRRPRTIPAVNAPARSTDVSCPSETQLVRESTKRGEHVAPVMINPPPQASPTPAKNKDGDATRRPRRVDVNQQSLT